MSDTAIAKLHDNYAAAASARAFAVVFDAPHPESAFLPPDLFAPEGSWVEIGESGLGVIAP